MAWTLQINPNHNLDMGSTALFMWYAWILEDRLNTPRLVPLTTVGAFVVSFPFSLCQPAGPCSYNFLIVRPLLYNFL